MSATRSRICVLPAVPFPTACQWKPPAPAVVSATPLRREHHVVVVQAEPLAFSSYHTSTHRVAGAGERDVGHPRCCGWDRCSASDRRGGRERRRAQPLDAGLLEQKLFTGAPLPGVTPAQVAAPECPVTRRSGTWPPRRWSRRRSRAIPPTAADCCPPQQRRRRPRALGRAVCVDVQRRHMALPARSSAGRSHRFAAELKRLAKMFVGCRTPLARLIPGDHGTLRPAPGSRRRFFGLLSGRGRATPGSPASPSAPFLNARTKICCAPPIFCSKVAHGTAPTGRQAAADDVGNARVLAWDRSSSRDRR